MNHMKKLWISLFLFCITGLFAYAQQKPEGNTKTPVTRENLKLRPNSRDYTLVRKGNNHQRIVQMRTQAMIKHQTGVMNRKAAMERRRIIIQQQMMRQQKMRQRMIQNRTRTR
jgi:hypothetical protein